MKTYEQIEKELRELQEYYRHPKPELGVLPHPEGQIAALSVQFLQKELEREIELRDHAGDAAQTAQKAVAAMGEVMKVHGIDPKPWDWAVEKPEQPRPLPPSEYHTVASAMATIQKLRGEEREWEAKTGRLSGKICDLLAERHALKDRLAMKEQDITDLEDQVTVNRCAALAMFGKLKAAAVMARCGTSKQTAKYLLDAVNFHLNGALEGVKWLNAEQEREGQDQDQDHQHILDGEKPR